MSTYSTDGRTNERMDERTDGRVVRWTEDGRIDRVVRSFVRSFVRRRNGEETKGDVDETGGGDGGEVSDESCGVDERERE